MNNKSINDYMHSEILRTYGISNKEFYNQNIDYQILILSSFWEKIGSKKDVIKKEEAKKKILSLFKK